MKVNINQTVTEMAALKRQIAMLESMYKVKRNIMQKFFEKSGEKNYANDYASVYVQTKTTVDYDIPKLKNALDKELFNEIVERKPQITDWDGLLKLFKEKGIPKEEIKKYISVETAVSEKVVNKLYEEGELKLEDIEGCYTAKVTKTVALKLKEGQDENVVVQK